MGKRVIVVLLAGFMLSLSATTLKQLTLSDLAAQSTAVVRARVQPSYTALRGSVIYTHYTAQITEVWKGSGTPPIDIAVPGGVLNGIQQVYSGAPAFIPGQEYILFLWTSRSGLTQVMGLSQGLFRVSTVSGVSMVSRAASSENMLGAGGQSISDADFSMRLADFRASIGQMVGGPGVVN